MGKIIFLFLALLLGYVTVVFAAGGTYDSGTYAFPQKLGVGTTTPIADFQAATSTANATTSILLGKSGQNKGTCLTFYRTDGSPVYIFIAAGATVETISTTKGTSCLN